MLDDITEIALTARDDGSDGWDVPDPYLLTPANELVARGLAWAMRLSEPSAEHCDLLGRVVLRTSVMVWVVPAHRMLCPKLALATVDTLMAIDHPQARNQLLQLVGEIRVPVVIRRIGEHLDLLPEEIDRVVADLRTRGPLPRPDR